MKEQLPSEIVQAAHTYTPWATPTVGEWSSLRKEKKNLSLAGLDCIWASCWTHLCKIVQILHDFADSSSLSHTPQLKQRGAASTGMKSPCSFLRLKEAERAQYFLGSNLQCVVIWQAAYSNGFISFLEHLLFQATSGKTWGGSYKKENASYVTSVDFSFVCLFLVFGFTSHFPGE